MKVFDVIAWILVIVGGINWGCVGFFDFNLVDFFFTNMVIEKVIYDVIGVAAVFLIFRSKCCFSRCSSKKK